MQEKLSFTFRRRVQLAKQRGLPVLERDLQDSVVDGRSVQAGDRVDSVLVVRHVDESKPLALVGGWVFHDLNFTLVSM